jgi:hypothetical protein
MTKGKNRQTPKNVSNNWTQVSGVATIGFVAEPSVYLLVAMAYGLLGVVLCVAYYFSPRLRGEVAFHVLTVLIILLVSLVITLGMTLHFPDSSEIPVFRLLGLFLLFMGASLPYVAVAVFLMLHYWEVLLERITSPGSQQGPPRFPQTQGELWECVRTHLETLTVDPTNVVAHERLGDLYSRMGFFDAAVYQYLKAADWISHGYTQSQILYKAARIIVDKKKDVPRALCILRRIVRLYPRSFFAAYSRRIINHYEAHDGVENGDRGNDGLGDSNRPAGRYPE